MKIQIKWLDKRGGQLRFEKWENISEGKALEMLKRFAPKEYQSNLHELHEGSDISTDRYVLRNTEPEEIVWSATGMTYRKKAP